MSSELKSKKIVCYGQHLLLEPERLFPKSTYRVRLLRDENDSYGEPIGIISKKIDGDWSISLSVNYASLINDRKISSVSLFGTEEEAAKAVLLLRQTINDNPLSDDMRSYLEMRARHIRQQRENARHLVLMADSEASALQVLGEKHGIDLGINTPLDQEVQQLVAFLNENMDAIYDTLGKDWVRSLRGMIATIVEKVDPEAAQMI